MKTFLMALLVLLLTFLALPAANADPEGVSLFQEVVARVNAERTLSAEYTLAYTYKGTFWSRTFRSVLTNMGVSDREIGIRVIGRARSIPEERFSLSELNPLPTSVPSSALLDSADRLPAPTRLLKPETWKGVRYQVVEVKNPFPLKKPDSIPPNSAFMSLETVTARYYIDRDYRIRRIRADVGLSETQPDRTKPPVNSHMGVDMVVHFIRKANVVPERPLSTPRFLLSTTERHHQGDIAFSPDSKVIAVGENQGRILLVDSQTGKQVGQLEGLRSPAQRLAFSKDGKLLAAADSTSVTLWDINTQKRVSTLPEIKGFCLVQFTPDDRQLVITSFQDKKIYFWNPHTSRKELERDLAPSEGFLLSPSTNLYATVPFFGRVELRITRTGRKLHDLLCDTFLQGAAFSPDGKWLAIPDSLDEAGPSHIELWEVRTGNKAGDLQGSAGTIRAVAFSRDGTRMAAIDSNNGGDLHPSQYGVSVWDTATWKLLGFTAVTKYWYDKLQFSPDLKQLLTYGETYPISLWQFPNHLRPSK